MPTISQLPLAASVNAGDDLIISQAGATLAVTVGVLLAGTQPAIQIPQGTLLGRTSIGPGGPEPIALGAGLTLANATLTAAASAITGLAPVSTIAATDLVAISQGGQDHTITYANLLNGQTIDTAQPALAASDTDGFWVAQGSATMLRQSFAAVWNWIAAKLSSYKYPVVEITANTTLDGTVHNGRILICTAPVTLTPAFINMGSGFHCDVINLSTGIVTFAAGITTSTGAATLPAGQGAILRAASYSGGNTIFAMISGTTAVAGLATPGQVTGLAAGATTSASIALAWSAPATGGAPATYTVQYRASGAVVWVTASTTVVTPGFSLTGLIAATSYDFQVTAVNATGSGSASAILIASTAAAAALVTVITWNLGPVGPYVHATGTIGMNVHVNPATAAVRFAFSASNTVAPTTWTNASFVAADLWAIYLATPATAGTWYAWVQGTDGSASTVYSTAFTVT